MNEMQEPNLPHRTTSRAALPEGAPRGHMTPRPLRGEPRQEVRYRTCLSLLPGYFCLQTLLTVEIGAAMINGEGVPVPEARTVRLKVPAHWIHNSIRTALPPVAGPPHYKPHPDTLARLDRCLWCLTLSDITTPAKLRKCSRCGKWGQTRYPLYNELLFVEHF